jgi:hypothetical protein
METLKYIYQKFGLEHPEEMRQPIALPNFGRNEMADLFYELGYMQGAEVGVEQGVYSEVLLKANPSLNLYCIDAWQAYRGYRDHTRQGKLDTFYEITKKRLSPFSDRVGYIRMYSMDAVKEFNDESLDFVYIDANHDFINVAQDVFYWSKKVRKGGIIAGHDFVKRKNEAAHVHVRQVLQGYTDAYNIKPWFVLGREEERKGEVRDKPRSWMYVKI